MSANNMLAELRASRFLGDVAEEHLQALADAAKYVEFPAQTTIFGEHEMAKDVYIIVSGEVSVVVCLASAGCRQIATVRGGELLGWSPLLERRRLSATAVTKSPTKAIMIDGQVLAALCKQKPELGYEFMERTAQVLAERLYATRVQLVELSGSHLPQVTLESD